MPWRALDASRWMARLRGLLFSIGVVVAPIGWVALPWPGALTLLGLFTLWLAFTRPGAQVRAVASVGLRTLHLRPGASAIVVVGVAGVVCVLVALLATAEGYRHTLRMTGNAETVLVLRGGSATEATSTLDHTSVALIRQAPGIRQGADGEPLASAELLVAVGLPSKILESSEDASAQLRGVDAAAWAVRPQVRIIEGRPFRRGLRELVVGQSAAAQFGGLAVGRAVQLGSDPWTVVGIFVSGDMLESELWADAAVVADVFGRGSSRNAVTARLQQPQRFDAFRSALESDPRLNVEVLTTAEYFERYGQRTTELLRVIGATVGAIMAVGAVFAALNTFSAAIAARAREIATFRAIGFSAPLVVAAVMLEGMLLALAGAVLGGGLAWSLFDGYGASTLAAEAVGSIAFNLRVTPELLWLGVKSALAIGFVGALIPALQAMRRPVTATLRNV